MEWVCAMEWGRPLQFHLGGRTSKLLPHIRSHLHLALLSRGTWYHPWWCDHSWCAYEGQSVLRIYSENMKWVVYLKKKKIHKPLPWGCRIEEYDLGEGIYWTASLKNCRFRLPLLQMCCGIIQPCGSGLQIILPWSVCKYELGLVFSGFAFATG